jgi:hypothetical protein
VSISYEAATDEKAGRVEAEVVQPAPAAEVPHRVLTEDPVRGLVLALARAESDPKRGFVALKWFRDTYLPEQGYGWASSPEARHRAIVEADKRRWVLTSKVPNPKNPEFPVTSIRVNRPLQAVQEILKQESGFEADFAPIALAGERLSETVLRQRR